jgi:hypothetical protein
MYRSSVVIERMDYLMLEKGEEIFPRSDFINMISMSLEQPIEQIWRVKLHDNNEIELYSFAMPQTQKNLPRKHRLNRQSIPQWVNDRISVLQICEVGDTIKGVGQKVSDKVFYVIE